MVEESGLNVSKENQDSRTSEEKFEMNEGDLGSEVEGGPLEMVAGLGNEDGSLEYVMFEDGEDEEQERYLVEEGNPGDTEMVMVDANVLEGVPQTDDIGDLIGEKGRQKKKSGKLNAAATGGNAKKRAVKKVMAKHLSKVGEKGPVPPKKAPAKSKPDQDQCCWGLQWAVVGTRVCSSRWSFLGGRRGVSIYYCWFDILNYSGMGLQSPNVCMVSLLSVEVFWLRRRFPYCSGIWVCFYNRSLPAWSSGVDKGVKTREEGILVADGTSGESLMGCPYVEGYFVMLVPQNVGDDSTNTNRDLLSFLLVRLGNGVLVVALCHINGSNFGLLQSALTCIAE
ncbi:hypothetical protein YC2023_098005 [Brassica napus]